MNFLNEIATIKCNNLKNTYSEHIITLVKKVDKNKNIVMNLLFVHTFMDSYIKSNIIDKMFKSFPKPTYKLIISHFIQNPMPNSIWYELIKRASVFYNHAYMVHLKKKIKKLRVKICKKTIIVEDFIIIANLGSKGNKILYKFLDYTCKTAEKIKFYRGKYDENKNYAEKYFMILDKLNFITDEYCAAADDYSNLKSEIKNARDILKKTFDQMILPNKLQIYGETALKIFHIYYLNIFKEFETKIPGQNKTTVDSVYEKLNFYYKMLADFIEFFSKNYKKITIKQFYDISHCENLHFFEIILSAKIKVNPKVIKIYKKYVYNKNSESLLIRLSKAAETFKLCFGYDNTDLMNAAEIFIETLRLIPNVTFVEYNRILGNLRKHMNIKFENENLDRILTVVEMFSERIPLCNLLREFDVGDFNDLYEALKKKNNSLLTKEDLDSCKYIWEFQRIIINKETFAESIEIFVDPTYSELQSNLLKVNGKEDDIMDLQNEMFFNEEVKKDEIINLATKSYLKIQIRYKYIDIKLKSSKNSESYKYEDVVEFKDRALFIVIYKVLVILKTLSIQFYAIS